jgi:branched-chain amino acid transport system permease protein
MFIQLIILILVTFSSFYMIALAFSVSYSTFKFFNLSFAVDIVYAAYIFNTLFYNFHIVRAFSVLIAICFCVIFQLILTKFLFPRINNQNGFYRLIASLGILVIMQNTLSIVYGDTSINNSLFQNESFSFKGIILTLDQVFIILGALIIFLGNFLIFRYTLLGMHIKAVSSNKELSAIFGINTQRTELFSTIFSSIVFSLAGILYSSYTVLNPMYGFDLLLFGIISMIIGGIGSSWGLICGALLLATAQHLGAYFIDSKWMDGITYSILILFLIWKPLGFSGQQLKKIEI